MKYMKLFEEVDEPFEEEENNKFDEIIIDKDHLNGSYYLIKESFIFADGILQPSSVIYKIKVEKKDIPTEKNIKYKCPYFSCFVTHEQFLHDLLSVYPKKDPESDHVTYFLFKRWGDERMRYIFNKVYKKAENLYKVKGGKIKEYKKIDFNDLKNEVKRILDSRGNVVDWEIDMLCRKKYDKQ